MSGEMLRRAADQIRNDHGGVVTRNTRDGRRWLPVADWLDALADENDTCDQVNGIRNRCEHDYSQVTTLAAARAYLGEQT